MAVAKVLIRADASALLGGGHVMRSLTLADALAARGWQVVLAVNPEAAATVPALAASPHPRIMVAPGAEGLLAGLAERVDWAILDHYEWAAPDAHRLREAARRIMVIDDLADRVHDADLILDQTVGRTARAYHGLVPEGAVVLAGPAYALLRHGFAAARPAALARRRTMAPIARVLVSLGLTDLGGITAMVVERLLPVLGAAAVDVVLAHGAPSRPAVARLAAADPRVTLHPPTVDMVALTAAADLAVGAAGSSALERCCLGLPAITLVLADNQRAIAHALQEAGAARLVDSPAAAAEAMSRLLVEDAERQRMATAAAAVTDGHGTARVAAVLEALQRDAPPGSLRPVRDVEVEMLRQWRNDPAVRAASFSTDPIPADDHRRWWATVAEDPIRRPLLYEDGGLPRGIVLFSGACPDLRWSFYTTPGAPPGSGLALGASALDQALGRWGAESVTGDVRRDNARSLALHERLGFVVEAQPALDRVRYRMTTASWRRTRGAVLARLAERGVDGAAGSAGSTVWGP